jgi:CheY-like chemotaxis protein
MPNKTLRILIADEQLEQLMQVERMLNHLGYFRVAPVQSFEQLLAMVQSAIEPFDLLIADTAMAVRVGVDLPRFCKSNPLVRHALLYESQEVPLAVAGASDDPKTGIHLDRLPDTQALKTFMAMVDSPRVDGEQTIQVIDPRSPPAPAKRRSHRAEQFMVRH